MGRPTPAAAASIFAAFCRSHARYHLLGPKPVASPLVAQGDFLRGGRARNSNGHTAETVSRPNRRRTYLLRRGLVSLGNQFSVFFSIGNRTGAWLLRSRRLLRAWAHRPTFSRRRRRLRKSRPLTRFFRMPLGLSFLAEKARLRLPCGRFSTLLHYRLLSHRPIGRAAGHASCRFLFSNPVTHHAGWCWVRCTDDDLPSLFGRDWSQPPGIQIVQGPALPVDHLACYGPLLVLRQLRPEASTSVIGGPHSARGRRPRPPLS